MSVASIKGTFEDHAAHFSDLVDIVRRTPKPDGNLVSRQKLAEIRMVLARANDDFLKKKYQAALRGYKKVQGLVYGLIQPSFNPDTVFNPSLRLPMTMAVFQPLMSSSLDMVEKIAPNGIWSAFGGSTLSLPAEVSKEMKPFTDLGVSARSGVPPEAREAAMVGADYMANEEWAKAAEFFQLGLKAVGNGSDDATVAAKASMQMNLGTALLQAGDVDQATKHLDGAAKVFADAGDPVGQTQALANKAAALSKVGKVEEASKTLSLADNLLTKAGLSTKVPRPLAPDAGRPISGFAEASAGPLSRSASARPFAEPVAVSRNLNLRGSGIAAGPVMVNAGATISVADTAELAKTIESDSASIILRMPAASDGWIAQDLATVADNKAAVKEKALAAQFGETRLDLTWKTDERIDSTKVIASLYKARQGSSDVGLVNFRYDLDSDFSLRLPHLYHFSLPMKIGDCYRELGEYDAAIGSYRDAADYEYINREIEMPALWLRLAETAREWGDLRYRQERQPDAVDIYAEVMTLDEKVPSNVFLYDGPLKQFGGKAAAVIGNLDKAADSDLNPRLLGVLLDIRTRLRMIKAGLNFWGIPANYYPIFKFDYLQSIATHFAQLAVQAEREYISFTARGEDEELTLQQLEQSVESSKAEVDLSEEQLDYAQAEAAVTQENMELAALRRSNAAAQRSDYADAAYEMANLDAAMQFAGGPEGYKVSYTYYSPSEGKNVTLSGSDAYKVMADAAYKKGMISRELELANMDRQIEELDQNEDLAQAQHAAAEARVDVAEQQLEIAKMHQKHAEELLDTFNDQTFTPEVWFQIGAHLRWISASYMHRALAVARKVQLAYELETGFKVNVIKDSYTTSIVSGLLSADYLLKDIEYFSFHRIMQSKAKDVPVKQEFSLAALNPTGFAMSFKETGILDFDLSLADFDRAYPGAYLRKIKKVEIVVEGLLPPGGVHGTLRNTGISRDRRKNGDIFVRLQPRETLYLSDYSAKGDIGIFQPDPKVLEVFEHCGVASGWTLEIPPHANDVDYSTISDVRMIVYYTAQHDPLLETQVRANLPKTGSESVVIPFRILLPDAYFAFLDTGEMTFDLRAADFSFAQTNLTVREVAFRIARRDGADPSGISLAIETSGASAADTTDANGTVRSDPNGQAPLNSLRGNPVLGEWHVAAPDGDNPGFDRSTVRDLFVFVEYDFDYRGL